MTHERVELNGTEENVTCPECGSIVVACSKCGLSFKVGETVFCDEGDPVNHHHYHEDCFQVFAERGTHK